MKNQYFAVSLFPEWSPKVSGIVRIINKFIRKRPVRLRLERVIDGRYDMTSLEQRLHLIALLTDAVEYDVPGDVVEIGSFEGKTAALLSRVLEELNSLRPLHVYDAFDVGYFLGTAVDVEARLRTNFESVGARLPMIHKGYFEETLPFQLPDKISYVHLDCGVGPDQERHRKSMLHCLNSFYPRLSPGGVCVLMDY